ncbi:taspase, threonine aspartase, 1, partial [Coelomomyces lativittatus]
MVARWTRSSYVCKLLCGSNALPWFMQYTPSLVVPPSSLISDLSLLRYHAHLDIYMNQCEWEHALNHDTVGAVVMDSDGQVAAGVSSGGISLKYKGRVGEAAMYGAGCWAETLGSTSVGVSCSGTGESIMQALLAKSCSTSLLCNPSEFGDLRH